MYSIVGLFLIGTLYFQIRYSKFGFLFITFLLWHFFAFSLAPIFDINNISDVSFINYQYHILNDDPGFLTALHLFLYAMSLFFTSYITLRSGVRSDITLKIESLVSNPEFIFKFLLIIGVVSNCLYFYSFGLKNALMMASSMRSNHYDGDTGFLFLKSISYISLYSACFIPYLIKSSVKNKWWLVILYCILVILAYLNSVSRTILLTYLMLPLFLTTMMGAKKLSVKKIIALILTFTIGSVILFYGKSFGNVMSSFVDGGNAVFVEKSVNLLDVILKLVHEQSYLWYSVDAGVDSFLSTGVHIPIEIILSITGFIPSSLLNNLGLGILNPDSVSMPLSCLNSSAFNTNDCTVPTRLIGYSSYFMPLIGGVLYGVTVGWVLSSLNKAWKVCESYDIKTTWVPYLLWLLFSAFLTFVPNTISRAFFLVFIVAFLYLIKVTIKRLRLV